MRIVAFAGVAIIIFNMIINTVVGTTSVKNTIKEVHSESATEVQTTKENTTNNYITNENTTNNYTTNNYTTNNYTTNENITNNYVTNNYITYEDNLEAVEERDLYMERVQELESEQNQKIVDHILENDQQIIYVNDYTEFNYTTGE